MPKCWRIANWFERYEVNSKGLQAQPGDRLRLRSLSYIRVKLHPMGRGPGVLVLEDLCKHDGILVNECIGVFDRLLQCAGNGNPSIRGRILNQKDQPASLKDLAFWLSYGTARKARLKKVLDILCHDKLGWLIPDNSKPIQNRQEIPDNSGRIQKNLAPYIKEGKEIQGNTKKEEQAKNSQSKDPFLPSFQITRADTNQAQAWALKIDSIIPGRGVVQSKADMTCLVRFAKWLLVEHTKDRAEWGHMLSLYCRRLLALQKAFVEGTGNKPLAVFFAEMSEELGYRGN